MVAQGGNLEAVGPGGLEHGKLLGRLDRDAVDINRHLFGGGGFHLVRKFLNGHDTYSLTTESNWQDS